MIFYETVNCPLFTKKVSSVIGNDCKRWTKKRKKRRKKIHMNKWKDKNWGGGSNTFHISIFYPALSCGQKKRKNYIKRVPLLCRSYTQNTPRDWACLRLNFQSLGHVPCNIETWPPFRSLPAAPESARRRISLRRRDVALPAALISVCLLCSFLFLS